MNVIDICSFLIRARMFEGGIQRARTTCVPLLVGTQKGASPVGATPLDREGTLESAGKFPLGELHDALTRWRVSILVLSKSFQRMTLTAGLQLARHKQ